MQGSLATVALAGRVLRPVRAGRRARTHARSRSPICGDCRQLLKPGGTLFMAVPSLDSWSARRDARPLARVQAGAPLLLRQRDAPAAAVQGRLRARGAVAGLEDAEPRLREAALRALRQCRCCQRDDPRRLRRCCQARCGAAALRVGGSGVNVIARAFGQTAAGRAAAAAVRRHAGLQRTSDVPRRHRAAAGQSDSRRRDRRSSIVESNSTDGTREAVRADRRPRAGDRHLRGAAARQRTRGPHRAGRTRPATSS